VEGACPQGGRRETFLKSFLQESGRYDTIIEMAKRIHFLNSVALGLPLLKRLKSNNSKNKLRCHRGYKPLLHDRRSGDLPALLKTEADFGLTNFMRNLFQA
jgi:hypothetical protein